MDEGFNIQIGSIVRIHWYPFDGRQIATDEGTVSGISHFDETESPGDITLTSGATIPGKMIHSIEVIGYHRDYVYFHTPSFVNGYRYF